LVILPSQWPHHPIHRNCLFSSPLCAFRTAHFAPQDSFFSLPFGRTFTFGVPSLFARDPYKILTPPCSPPGSVGAPPWSFFSKSWSPPRASDFTLFPPLFPNLFRHCLSFKQRLFDLTTCIFGLVPPQLFLLSGDNGVEYLLFFLPFIYRYCHTPFFPNSLKRLVPRSFLCIANVTQFPPWPPLSNWLLFFSSFNRSVLAYAFSQPA